MQHGQHVGHGLASASLGCQVDCLALSLLLHQFPHAHLLYTTWTPDVHLLQLIHHLFRKSPLAKLGNRHLLGFLDRIRFVLHDSPVLDELLIELVFVEGREGEGSECSDDAE